MKKTKTWFAGGLAMLLIVGSAKSQPVSLNLKQAIEMAFANNNSLKADSMNLVSAGYQQQVAKASQLPQVSYATKTEYNLAIPSQMLPGSIVGEPSKEFVPVKFGTKYNLTTGVEVNQSIWNKTNRLQVASARLNTEIAATRHKLSREELAYEIAKAYYALQANGEMIRTTAHDYANILEIVRISKAQFENGVLKRIDYESLQINAANKQSELDQLQTKQTEQLAYFKYLLGVPVSTDININEPGGIIPAFNEINSSPLFAREDIHLNQQMRQAKELEIKTIRAEQAPVVNSFFRFNYLSQFNTFSDISKSDYRFKSSTVGISASVSLFDGYRRKNRLKIASSELFQLRFQGEQQEQLAQTEWTSANETLRSGRQQYRLTQQNLVLAEKVFTSRKALYAEGVSTLIELLDAERELSKARNLDTQAMINVHTALLDVYKAKGTLLTDFIKSL
jgi:outer membrane protein TolC